MAAEEGKVDFNFEVRPILADRCFKCHGPDEKSRKAKLRLDMAASAFAVREEGTDRRAVVPGHPEKSELFRRITTTNEDDRMPPVNSNLVLSDSEKELLRRWIAQGAEYKPHWAFLPVKKFPVPVVPGLTNPVDAFVSRKLEENGLTWSPEASRETLIRRLSFDLRGLPPTLEEIEQFCSDASPTAYEQLVERLLASPAYGEHQAKAWLDLARYADTYGYQNDVARDVSPWRDWVIRAFNENLPYDQFITWQLAGDLLPNPTREQIIATAFSRLHRQTNEGGSIEEEFRAEYVADRVATTGTAFLGLTLGCARCHDHKFDPIKQADFYRMSAFFNNIDESGLYAHFTRATPSPSLVLFSDEAKRQHDEIAAQISSKERGLAQETEAARLRFDGWRQGLAGPRTNLWVVRAPTAMFDFEQVISNSIPNLAPGGKSATLVDGPEQTEGIRGKALKFSGDNYAVCNGAGAFNRTVPFSFSLWLRPTEAQERAVIFHRTRAWTDSGSRGYELVLENGKPAFGLIHFWPGNAIEIRGKEALPLNRWSHLVLTYDGSSHASGLHLFLNGTAAPVEIVRDHLFKDILHRSQWGDMEVGNIELTLAGRFRDSGFRNGAIDEFKVFDCELTPLEARRLSQKGGNASSASPAAREASSGTELAEQFAYYVQCIDRPCAKLREELGQLRRAENEAIDDVPELMVMKEMSPRRPTFILKRGAYDARGEEVFPGVPEQIFAFDPALPRNRLGLAKWTTDPANPLTARVAVNRLWRSHFGRGLVTTVEDFGTQGKLPTHPALLDWLASRFIESHWDVKAMHRLIVTSRAYRQASLESPELAAKDPEDIWLERYPRHRLEAEEIRDNALAVSGLLSRRIGGPSVKPYQPEGLWEQSGAGAHYTQDKGEGLYRRSLYTFWKRTVPPPNMLIFDAPSREVCTARRETTTTPLQALVLLNDTQFVEAARVLAERTWKASHDDARAAVSQAFRLVTGRRPEPRELELLEHLFQEQAAQFAGDVPAAEKLLGMGEHPRESSLQAPEAAAATVVASALFNLDEFSNEW